MQRPLVREDFEIGIICALQCEYDAVALLFDEFWDEEGDLFNKANGDYNAYRTGRVGKHNVVLALLPHIGKVNAAGAAASFRSSYGALRLVILAGICGGVPFIQSRDVEVLLGDVIISKSVVQYDFGRQYPDRFIRKNMDANNFSKQDKNIHNLLALFDTRSGRETLEERTAYFLKQLQLHDAKLWGSYQYPGPTEDKLFESKYRHKHHLLPNCTCGGCQEKMDPVFTRKRLQQGTPRSIIHIGAIASGDSVMKSGEDRDRIAKEEGIIAFEMEGAGVWEELPCIIVKGVCDYADCHKNKKWQNFAAAVAASASKAILERYIKTDRRSPYLTQKQSDSKGEINSVNASLYIPQKHSSPHFIGRADYIDRIAAFFQPRRNDEPPGRREFLLHGPGGFGKTQICLRFAEEYSRLFWRVYWIDATNKQSLNNSFHRVAQDPEAKSAGLDGSIEATFLWLSAQRREWLLILDNADEYHDSLDESIPGGIRSNILISSRSASLQYRVPHDQAMRVSELSPDEAKQLLWSVGPSHQYPELTAKVDEELGKIVQELSAIPLAIHHAATAILNGYCKLWEYREMLSDRRKLMLQSPSYRGDSGYNNTLYSAWSLTITQLKNRTNSRIPSSSSKGEISKDSICLEVELLSLLGFFHHSAILEDIFHRAAIQHNEKVQLVHEVKLPRVSSDIPHGLLNLNKNGNWDQHCFREAIQALHGASLIQIDVGHNTYSIHPLIHAWSRERLTPKEQQRIYSAARAILVQAIASDTTPDGHNLNRQLIPHMISLRKAMEDLNLKDLYADDYASDFWRVFLAHGYYAEAEVYARMRRDGRTHHLWELHPLTLEAIERLAMTMKENVTPAILKKSIDLLSHAVEIRELLQPESVDTLNAKIALGTLYQHKGERQSAEVLFKYVWDTAKNRFGESEDVSIRAATALGAIYMDQGKLDEAEKLQRVILSYAKATFGEDHEKTLGIMGTLAATLNLLNKLEESEALKIHILEKRKVILGDDHPDTLLAQANLAATYSRQKKWQEAEATIREVTDKRLKVLGEYHRETLRGRVVLTGCYIGQGRFEEAIDEGRKALEGREKILGHSHPDTLWAMRKLAEALEGQGQVEEATGLRERVLKQQCAKQFDAAKNIVGEKSANAP
ncbi:tetratricopeptide repeat domain-containing protein [Trichoderma breve]|uniref:Tetratricopeptide repeat domain-containing protein n=1 Tax=Trichoderma breve TaxID=2034170 RepID=A0A9W9BEA7_9HYPO|nr:tetratricopeptide repeat domain-containing protein [Trichoderma breve]KAJ4859764.1 tetratricopeptide repeat domain-containing protein [Trichoderma breve]